MDNTDFKQRLVNESKELTEKTNKLNGFMQTQGFASLDDESKALLHA